MECKNHPTVEAVNRCAGCAEAFCGNCLVEVRGKKYCADCKQMEFSSTGQTAPGNLPNETASKALKYAIIGIFCFGVILGPMAISKALEAKRNIEANPRLGGSGTATAALIIGILEIVLWVIGILARVATIGR